MLRRWILAGEIIVQAGLLRVASRVTAFGIHRRNMSLTSMTGPELLRAHTGLLRDAPRNEVNGLETYLLGSRGIY